jgi:hypothetical protein
MVTYDRPKYFVIVIYDQYEQSAFSFATLKEAKAEYAKTCLKYRAYLTKVLA